MSWNLELLFVLRNFYLSIHLFRDDYNKIFPAIGEFLDFSYSPSSVLEYLG